MKIKELLIMMVEFIMIVILSVLLINANKKISKYEEQIANMEEVPENEEQEDSEENERNGETVSKEKVKEKQERQTAEQETIKMLAGTDQKNGLYIQNVRIETKNGVSRLYADVVNNLGKEVKSVNFNMCLTGANRTVINKYPQSINSIKVGETKTIDVTVNNIENIQGFYIE